ncbi:YlxR family protein [Mycoplasmatota bacterium zrk1]
MSKKIPLRKCVVSGERLPKKELVRIVKNKDGMIFIDETGKANGRGAYISLTKANIKKAMSKKMFDRVFDTKIDEEIYNELLNYYEEKNS